MTNRIPRIVFTAGVLSLVAMPLAAGAAYADSASHHKPGATAKATTTPTTTLTTRVVGAHVRNRPTTDKSARTVGTVAKKGTAVKVHCYTTGTAVGKDKTWYHILAPVKGYIAGHLLDVKAEPAAGVPMCKA